MKTKLRYQIFLILILSVAGGERAVADESLFHKVKQFLTGTPTPTPTPQKKKKVSAKTGHTATTSHHPSPSSKSTSKPSPSPARTPSPRPTPTPRPSPTATATPSSTPGETPETSPSASPMESVSPSETAAPPAATAESPTSSLESSETPEAVATPRRSGSPIASATPGAGNGSTVSLAGPEISGYERYSPDVRKVLDQSLSLTTQNLSYKYGSADPKNGGMDCSGFVYYVLNKCGVTSVPRDAREQYIWVRKAGNFQAVLGRSQDTFELDALKPGDLLFWSGTYNVDRDPAITHVMIYLGREKSTNQRVMVGASDGRTYKGRSRFGVSVFDFTIAGRHASKNEPGPTFVGYAHVPGLGGN